EGVVGVGDAFDGEGVHGFEAAFNDDRADRLPFEQRAHGIVSVLTDYNIDFQFLGGGFKTRGEIHGVADGGVFHVLLGTDIADYRTAGINADTHLEAAASFRIPFDA